MPVEGEGAAARVVRVLLVPEVLLAHRVQQTLVTQRGDRSTAAEGGVQRKFGVGPAGLAFSLVGKVTLDVRVSYGYEGTGERLVLRDEVMVDTENVHGSVGPLDHLPLPDRVPRPRHRSPPEADHATDPPYFPAPLLSSAIRCPRLPS
ncbi:hypothetical protein GCM10009536_18750 [Streptomyces thermocarboxydus]